MCSSPGTRRTFKTDDVVTLDNKSAVQAPPMTAVKRRARFSGAKLGFVGEKTLKPTKDGFGWLERLRARLKTMTGARLILSGQRISESNLHLVTVGESRKIFSAVGGGNFSAPENGTEHHDMAVLESPPEASGDLPPRYQQIYAVGELEPAAWRMGRNKIDR